MSGGSEAPGMKVSRCKGTRDLMPQDMARFRRVEGVFRDCCLGWGYEEIRTPTLEHLHLFTSAGTLSPDMLGRVYSFLDWDGWSGERVVLRPDGTIPAARLYVEGLGGLPLTRLFYVENMFAFEETRERWQCGVELIGDERPEADVELVLLGLEVLRRLWSGPVEVRLSHAGVIKAFLEGAGLGDELQSEVLARVFSGNAGDLGEVGAKLPHLEGPLKLLFELKGDSPSFVSNLISVFSRSFPALGPGLENLARVAELLSAMGCGYQIDLASEGNFEYYTGAIFRFEGAGQRLGGGGRYDGLVSLVGGGDTPASGFALSADRLMDLVEADALASRERVRVVAGGGGVEDLRCCFEVAAALRERGYVAEMGWCPAAGPACRWSVSVRIEGGVSRLELVDGAGGKSYQLSSVDEVVRALKEGGCS